MPMIQAQLHGKAPSELTWSEDILTSNIFGMLKYLSTPEITTNILKNSVNLGNIPLPLPEEIEKIDYIFWPRLHRSEPDLVLLLHSAQGEHLVGIEAKYLSKKSSLEDTAVDELERTNAQRDQLAREIEDLHDPRNYAELNVRQDRLLSIHMIYLTLESYMPRSDLNETMISVRNQKERLFNENQLYWLSWKSMYAAIKSTTVSGVDQMIIEDLLKYLERKDLITFSGFAITTVNHLGWIYTNSKRSPIRQVASLSWNYGREHNGAK